MHSQEERVSLRVEDEIERQSAFSSVAADEAARSGDLRTSIEYASGARHTIQLYIHGTSSAPGIRVTRREGEGWGATLFLFTAAVWCAVFGAVGS